MTLKQVKDEVSRNHGWPNWDEFIGDPEICFAEDRDLVSIVTDEIAKRYAKAKLEEVTQGLERHIIYEKAVIDKLNMPDRVRDAKIRLDVYVEIQTSITKTPLD